MPHDKNGVKIEFGDWLKVVPYNFPEHKAGDKNAPVVGRVVQMREGQSCSGDVVWPSIDGMRRDAFGAGEAEVVLKADGTEPERNAA